MAGVRVKRKKQRAKNFCEGELKILFEGVALKKDLLFSKLNTAVVSKNKAKAWNNIADKINSQFHGTRTGKQVKKKWQDVKQECLRIRALQKCPPTGGDPPPEDPWYADAVLNVLGEKTNLLDGIPGGHESDAPVVPVVVKEENVVPGGLSSMIIPDDSCAQASTTGHPVESPPFIISNTATNMLPGESAHSSSSPSPTNLQGSSKPSSASSKQNALAQLKKQTQNRKLQSGENTQSKREWADEKVGELAVEDREYALLKKQKVELELEVLRIEKANKLLLQAKTVLEIRNLEFQKAESDLNCLSRKLELRCQNSAQGDSRRNPTELLQKVEGVKKEYKALLREAAEIHKVQTETMDCFRKQLLMATQLLQELETRTSTDGCDDNKGKIAELASLLGIQLPAQVAPAELKEQMTPDASGAADPQKNTEQTDRQSSSSAVCPADSSNTTENGVSSDAGLDDPVTARAALRASSTELVEVSQEEFDSVSELVRGRVKLSEVNTAYRVLWKHFKEEHNSNPLLPAEMHKMGLRVTGATGKAKLKVLRALKLLTISSKEEVKLV